MLINLEEPFRSIWKSGYLQKHENGRQYICLFNSEKDRSIISYARYLMCVKLGFILGDEYEVDHKDDDKTNDDINNLQVLTKEQNLIKQQWNYIENVQICYGFSCAYCTTNFILTERIVKMRMKSGVKWAFCSRRCAALFHKRGQIVHYDPFVYSF